VKRRLRQGPRKDVSLHDITAQVAKDVEGGSVLHPLGNDLHAEDVADAVLEEILAKYPKSWLIERGKRAGVNVDDIP